MNLHRVGFRALPMSKTKTAFVSYSHESTEHTNRVLSLADALREHGIESILDQYHEPAEGWPLWMLRHLVRADFILIVCTAVYHRRLLGTESPGKGLGVRWEGHLVVQMLYDSGVNTSRFLPVLLPGHDSSAIPILLRGTSDYRVAVPDLSDDGFERLVRRITEQPSISAPTVADEPVLPSRTDPASPFPRVMDSDATFAIVNQAQVGTARRSSIMEHLIECTTRPDPTERYWSYIAIGEIGGPSAEFILRKGLYDDHAFARSGAERGLSLIEILPG